MKSFTSPDRPRQAATSALEARDDSSATSLRDRASTVKECPTRRRVSGTGRDGGLARGLASTLAVYTQGSGCNSGNGSVARALVACSSAGCHGQAPRQCPFQLVCFPALLTAHMLALLDQPTPLHFVKLSTHTHSLPRASVSRCSLCALCASWCLSTSTP
jgi:hypothetical protein